MNDKENKKLEKNLENIIVNESSEEVKKGPANFLIGSITSFLLCFFSFYISKKIAYYFAMHRPLNTSEVVQSISTSFNTLIVGLSFLATFSFGFIAIGLFIVFIRSFFLKIK